MGSFATQDESFMTAVYRELRHANLPFLHVAGVPRAVCRPLASRVGAAYDEPDAQLDSDARHADTKQLEHDWTEILDHARQRTTSLILLRITPTTAPWLAHAFDPKRLEGLELSPLSTVIRRPTASR